MATLPVLFLGDVVGSPGLSAVRRHLSRLVTQTDAALVVANGENVAGGLGITPKTANALFAAGVDVITTGNHVWDRREILGAVDSMPRLLRPANYPEGTPGSGWCRVAVENVEVGVLNLSGRIFMDPLDCPFRIAERVLEDLGGGVPVVLVDFHAEATSEKLAFGCHLDGRVTAVVGTHTHVPTADARVLPGGTGYITDLGMSGVVDSVIGVPKTKAISRFRSRMPGSLGVARGEATVMGVVIEADAETGACLNIRRIEAGPDVD